MRVFIPIEDAPVDASMALLIPYRCGLRCEHALREMPDFAVPGPDRIFGRLERIDPDVRTSTDMDALGSTKATLDQ
jgi:hypothetical protein